MLNCLATFTAVIPLQGSQTRNICNVNNVPGVFYPFILPAITEIKSHGNPLTKTTVNSSDQVTRPTWTQNLATRPSHHRTQSCVLLLMHSRQWSPHLNSFLHQDYCVEIVANMTFNFAIKNRFLCLHFDGSTKTVTNTTAKPCRQRRRRTHLAIAKGCGYRDNDLQLALPIGEYIDTSILQVVANNNIGKSTQDTVMVTARYYHLLHIFPHEFWVNLAMTEMNNKQHLLDKKLAALQNLISSFSDPDSSYRKVDLVTMKPGWYNKTLSASTCSSGARSQHCGHAAARQPHRLRAATEGRPIHVPHGDAAAAHPHGQQGQAVRGQLRPEQAAHHPKVTTYNHS